MRIETGIPPPAERYPATSTLAKLAVGQSFKAPISRRATLHVAANRRGMRVATKRLTKGTMRVWRTA